MNTHTLPLEDFFKDEYISFSVYDNVRKLGSYIDGQKNASRKILHTVIRQNIDKFVKVSNLGPKVQDYAQYLHGSLESTIVNMTADYVGSGNNLPLLEGDGNFGSTFIPDASATRYIFARMNPILKSIFIKDDYEILNHQLFENESIEPRFYVPVLPLIAINGSEGVSIGFAQKILPRDPKQILKWVKQRTKIRKPKVNLTPHWNGMKCTVESGELDTQWIIKGNFYRKSKHRLVIDALPIGYTLKQYQAVLDKLVDDKDIKDYDDLSDNDEFLFEILVDRQFSERDDEWILNKLKLVKKITENFTCIDEDNKIIIFNSIDELLNAWYEKRIEFNNLRKQHVLQQMQVDLDYITAKSIFISGVVNGKIELRNKKEQDVILQAEKYNQLLTPYIQKFLSLPMKSLTEEEIAKLNAKSADLHSKIIEYGTFTFEEILLKDALNITI